MKFTVKNETPEQEKKNKRLLVPIPYSEVQKALDRFTMSEQLRESTLVTKYAPKEKKAISPSALKWPKLVHEMSEVTTAVLPKREARSAQPSATQEDEDPSTPPPTKKKKHGAAATTDDFPPPPKKKKTTDAAAVAEEDAEPPIQYSAAPAEDRRRFLQGTSAVEPAPAPEAAPSAAQTNGTSAYKMCSMTEVREVDVVSGAPNSELDFGVFKAPSWAKKATLTVEYLP